MDFSLSEVQKMLRQEARSFLEKECSSQLVRQMEQDETGYPSQLWRQIAELGWMAIPFPEKYDGVDGNFIDLIVLIEEMGRICFPSPFVPTVVLGGLAILELGTEDQKDRLLPGIAAGDTICTLALLEVSNSYDPAAISCQASTNGNGYHLKGTKLFVPDAHVADLLLVAARTQAGVQDGQSIGLFVVDTRSQGITCDLLKTISGEKQFEVNLDVTVPEENLLGHTVDAGEALKKISERAAVVKCAEMVGGAQRVLEMTVGYAKERQQFGRPIGSFQAIQHYCANMATDVDASRFNSYRAAWLIDQGLPCRKEVAVAKAWCSQAYRRVTALSHQIHGAIGWTKDLDLELYTRRAKAAELAFGDADFHKELIARELGLDTP